MKIVTPALVDEKQKSNILELNLYTIKYKGGICANYLINILVKMKRSKKNI